MEADLDREAKQIQSLLSGKSIAKVFRPTANEICIQCTDKTRLFIEVNQSGNLEFSIT
ncbi:hypothetical protein [Shewanella denitrificans]|jgi:hypothetical protein|uniref:hypothetical protein n=1 Tax=Shewanella denitrificans TaxID=192073 RepID=UPI0002DB958F|nr:hypothetical protein [Shewanella denitrificans]